MVVFGAVTTLAFLSLQRYKSSVYNILFFGLTIIVSSYIFILVGLQFSSAIILIVYLSGMVSLFIFLLHLDPQIKTTVYTQNSFQQKYRFPLLISILIFIVVMKLLFLLIFSVSNFELELDLYNNFIKLAPNNL